MLSKSVLSQSFQSPKHLINPSFFHSSSQTGHEKIHISILVGNMNAIYSILLAFAALDLSVALPSPMADRPQPPAPDHYYIDTQSTIDGTPFTGGVSVIGGGSESFFPADAFSRNPKRVDVKTFSAAVQIQEQYSVGYTVELGADLSLNIDDIIGVGVPASVSKSTETAISESASYTCPDGAWTCALKVLPSVVHVQGHFQHNDILTGGSMHNYEVTIPRTDSNGNAVVEVTLCACGNRLAWADPGAPPKCPQDCS